MKKISILFSFLVVSFFMNTSLYAGTIPIIFGHYEDTHKIVDVKLLGKDNEKLFLGYKTDSFYLEAGVFIKDAGYILGIEGEEGSYYPMPTGDDLRYYQDKNLLPNPLPQYNIPIMDYLIGYSLWIIAFLFAAYYIGTYMAKREEQEETDSQEVQA